MNCPLVAVVFAYAAGLLFAQLFQPPLAALFGFTFFVLVLVLVFKKARLFLIWPFLALVGWTNFAAHTAVISPNDLRTLLGREPAIVTIHGTLAETPRLKIVERDEEEKWRSVVRVRVREMRRENNFLPADGEILATTPDVLGATFFAGQPVEISGVIAPPAPPLADGLFDFQNYLATRGIFYQLKTESTNDWKLLEPHSVSAAAHRPFFELVEADARARPASRRRTVAAALGHDAGLAHRLHRRHRRTVSCARARCTCSRLTAFASRCFPA